MPISSAVWKSSSSIQSDVRTDRFPSGGTTVDSSCPPVADRISYIFTPHRNPLGWWTVPASFSIFLLLCMSSATPPTAASGRFAFSFCGHQVALRFFISLLERFVTNRLHILSDEDFKNLIRLKIYVDLFKHLSIQSSTSLNLITWCHSRNPIFWNLLTFKCKHWPAMKIRVDRMMPLVALLFLAVTCRAQLSEDDEDEGQYLTILLKKQIQFKSSDFKWITQLIHWAVNQHLNGWRSGSSLMNQKSNNRSWKCWKINN